MTGKPGRGGRPRSKNPKRRVVGFRVDDSIGDIFDAALAAAAEEAPLGSKFTASDYLRGLFLRDAAARRLTPEASAAPRPKKSASPKKEKK
jgi:hypothetical protein